MVYRFFVTLAIVLTVAIVGLLAGQAAAPADASFDQVLATHLAAIQARDLPALERTLTEGTSLEMIGPDGGRLATRQAYVDFHKKWFALKTWTFKFEPVWKTSGPTFGMATIRYRYDDVVDGKPIWSECWLTLTFERQRGRWALIHDQNTLIKRSN